MSTHSRPLVELAALNLELQSQLAVEVAYLMVTLQNQGWSYNVIASRPEIDCTEWRVRGWTMGKDLPGPRATGRAAADGGKSRRKPQECPVADTAAGSRQHAGP